MKRVVLILATVILTASFAFAQDNCKNASKDGKCPVCEKVEKMKKDLNLNDQQAKEVKALFQKKHEAMKAKMEAAKKNGQKMDEEAMKAEMQKEKTATEASMKKILTPEQFAKFQQMAKQCGKDGKKECKGDCKEAKKGCKGDCKKEAVKECKGDCKGDCKKEAKKECDKCKTEKK